MRLGIEAGALIEGSREVDQLARRLAYLCDVSVESASIRLRELACLAHRDQVKLL